MFIYLHAPRTQPRAGSYLIHTKWQVIHVHKPHGRVMKINQRSQVPGTPWAGRGMGSTLGSRMRVGSLALAGSELFAEKLAKSHLSESPKMGEQLGSKSQPQQPSLGQGQKGEGNPYTFFLPLTPTPMAYNFISLSRGHSFPPACQPTFT